MFQNIRITSIFSEVRKSVELSLPLIASYIVQSSSSFIATAMVAHLGKEDLAAAGLVWSLYITCIVFLAGTLSSVSVLVAQNRGAKNNLGISYTISQGLILGIVLSIPTILLFLFAPYTLRWSGQAPVVVHIATQYLHALNWSILPLIILIIMDQFLIGLGKTRLVLWITIIQIPCEIFANYVFIFGKFGVHAFGVPGIGYGFTIVFTLATIIIGYFLARSKTCRPYQVFVHLCHINRQYLWEILRIGLPIGSMLVIEVAMFLVVAFLMGRLGSNVLAAHQIVLQYWGVSMALYYGISESASIRVGYEVGANNLEGVKRAGYVNMWLGFFVLLFVAFYFIVFPKNMIGLDVNIHAAKFAQLLHYATIFLALSAIYQLFDNFRLIAVGALRGLKDTKIPMMISAIAFWGIGLPLAYVFGDLLRLGGAGIWLALTVGTAIGAIILVWRFHVLTKRVKLDEILI